MADAKNNDRKDRLSAALRENLKRRKQQLRGRAASQPGEGGVAAAEPEQADDAGDTSGDAYGNERE
jgi:hypothetical protein